jgi:hypothetical protein
MVEGGGRTTGCAQLTGRGNTRRGPRLHLQITSHSEALVLFPLQGAKLNVHTSVRICPLCYAGCAVTFDKDKCDGIYYHGSVIL